MKWFLALNQSCRTFDFYAEMVKVAVHSALKNTSLVPYFLYDGEDNDLTEWLLATNVQIIKIRSFLYDELNAVANKRGEPSISEIGVGAFLRLEIPSLATAMNLDDEYVLYTDCDVMFLHDVCEYLEKLNPLYFAVAPEFDSDDFVNINTGVMLMNLKTLRKVDADFRRFVVANLESLSMDSWDQSAYRIFYNPAHKMHPAGVISSELIDGMTETRSPLVKPKWDRLPVEYNWKPYWGDYSSAKVIHFHGPKPFQRELLSSESAPQGLIDLDRGSFRELCDVWDEMLAEA